jgi:hypothetical protein
MIRVLRFGGFAFEVLLSVALVVLIVAGVLEGKLGAVIYAVLIVAVWTRPEVRRWKRRRRESTVSK